MAGTRQTRRFKKAGLLASVLQGASAQDFLKNAGALEAASRGRDLLKLAHCRTDSSPARPTKTPNWEVGRETHPVSRARLLYITNNFPKIETYSSLVGKVTGLSRLLRLGLPPWLTEKLRRPIHGIHRELRPTTNTRPLARVGWPGQRPPHEQLRRTRTTRRRRRRETLIRAPRVFRYPIPEPR